MKDRRMRLSALWIFYTLNILYADVETALDKSVVVNLSQSALFGAAILVETPIAMTLLSNVLKYRANRWANIIVGAINTAAVLLSFLVGTPTAYYIFFATIETLTSLYIIWYAWKWPNPEGLAHAMPGS